MQNKSLACALLGLCLPINAIATAPDVAVDIAPLHSLVSQVMEGVKKPGLIIPAEASPHEYTLRPTQARALSEADIVFWIGEELTPWLEKALSNVSDSSQKVKMLELETTTKYAFREGATFEGHNHEDHSDEHEEEHHDEHHDGHADNNHEGADPHAWLDPENAKAWVSEIKSVLSKHDPENSGAYERNANKAIASLDELIKATQSKVNSLGKLKFIVFHDAYQYFEQRFGISAAGSITLGDAQAPSPARIIEIRDTVKKLGVNCAFTEPQYNEGIVHNVFEGTSISGIGVMDPIGANIQSGSQHYSKLIQAMVNSLGECNK